MIKFFSTPTVRQLPSEFFIFVIMNFYKSGRPKQDHYAIAKDNANTTGWFKGCYIIHKDGNYFNNIASNLECVTLQEYKKRNIKPATIKRKPYYKEPVISEGYFTAYCNLIKVAQYRGLSKNKHKGYIELHHIIPRCIGGKDIEENCILLTFDEHCLAHYLLSKLFDYNILKGAYIAMKNDFVRLCKRGKINEEVRIEVDKLSIFLSEVNILKIPVNITK